MSSVCEHFQGEHETIDTLFEDARNAVREGRVAHTFLEACDRLMSGLEMEERFLFPLFEQWTGQSRGPTEGMRLQHRRMENALDMMRRAHDRGDKTWFQHGYTKLYDILPRLNAAKERVLYPLIDEILVDNDDCARLLQGAAMVIQPFWEASFCQAA